MQHADPPRPVFAGAALASAATPAGRLLLAVSLLAGLLYPWLDDRWGTAADVAMKSAGVGCLALAAALAGRRGLALILALGALGDGLLEIPGLFYAGAGAFAAGHVTAMLVYGRQRRPGLGAGDRLAAAALIGFGLAMPMLAMPAGAPVGSLMLYSVLLCGMAAALGLSRFPRLALAGALLFVVSDTLLILRLGGTLVGGAALHGLALWYSYYAGQLLIFLGVSAGWPARRPPA